MRPAQTFITAGIVLVFLVLQFSITSQSPKKGLFSHSKSGRGGYPKRSRSGIGVGGALLAGAAVGAGGYLLTNAAIKELKKNEPCTGHGAGFTDAGQLDSKLAANQRCNDMLLKYSEAFDQSSTSPCSGANNATCQSLDGNDKCMVQTPNGGGVPIADCA